MKDYKFRYIFTIAASCLCTALTVFAVTSIEPGTVQNPDFGPGDRNVSLQGVIQNAVAQEVARVQAQAPVGAGGTNISEPLENPLTVGTGATNVTISTNGEIEASRAAFGGYNIDPTKNVTAPKIWADDYYGARYQGAEMTLTSRLCLAGTCKTAWPTGLFAGHNNSHLLVTQKNCTIARNGNSSCACDAGYVPLACPSIGYTYGFDPVEQGSLAGTLNGASGACGYNTSTSGFNSGGVSIVCLKVADQ